MPLNNFQTGGAPALSRVSRQGVGFDFRWEIPAFLFLLNHNVPDPDPA